MAKTPIPPEAADEIAPSDAQPALPTSSLAPPQRGPVLRDMTCSLMVGIGPSQVDCGACESRCASLPQSWRSTCLAACRSACAISAPIASMGRRVMSAFA